MGTHQFLWSRRVQLLRAFLGLHQSGGWNRESCAVDNDHLRVPYSALMIPDAGRIGGFIRKKVSLAKFAKGAAPCRDESEAKASPRYDVRVDWIIPMFPHCSTQLVKSGVQSIGFSLSAYGKLWTIEPTEIKSAPSILNSSKYSPSGNEVLD